MAPGYSVMELVADWSPFGAVRINRSLIQFSTIVKAGDALKLFNVAIKDFNWKEDFPLRHWPGLTTTFSEELVGNPEFCQSSHCGMSLSQKVTWAVWLMRDSHLKQSAGAEVLRKPYGGAVNAKTASLTNWESSAGVLISHLRTNWWCWVGSDFRN